LQDGRICKTLRQSRRYTPRLSNSRIGTPCARAGAMNQIAEELKARTKRFALDIIRFVNDLPHTIAAQEMARQLLRAGLGVAGNYRGACRSRSHREFTARIGVVLEEADESELWLELFSESNLPNVTVPEILLEESRALRRIFVASNLTARQPDR
jgi:four helix bundle protein